MGVNVALWVSTRSVFGERVKCKLCFLILTIFLGLCLILEHFWYYDIHPCVVEWAIRDNTLSNQRCPIRTRYLQKLLLLHVSYANSDIPQLVKLKVTFLLQQPVNPRRGSRKLCVYPLWTSTLDGGGWSTPCPGGFNPGRIPALIVQRAGWTPRPVWTSVFQEKSSCLQRQVAAPITPSRPLLTHWGRSGSFKLFKRPLPGFLTILTL